MKPHKRKKDYTPKILPVGFVSDKGEWFDIQLIKPNIRSLWIKLLPDGKTIKISKKSPKLRYRKET